MADDVARLGPRVGVPRLPAVFVPRRRLDVLLHDDHRLPVTLVSAPPGAGKTTLVTAALADHRGFVPLVVDRRHNEACRLAGVIADTLGVAVSGAQELPTVKGIQSAASLLDATFSQVERAGRRRVLALDDVQELASPDALGTLAYLVERAPVGLDVVLCSRADPPIRLTRLRLDGRLREIRNDQLAFDHAEAAELLAAHGVRLTRGQMDAIWRRTQGWAAGLRLAACALQREADPRELVDSMAATESAIVDYLLEELLTRQDRGLQQFLLRTSVAGRLTADLAQSLAADALAADRLAELERQGVVVADLDDPTWYRYHPLFAALLEARLRHRHRDLAEELHRRAASWFLSQDMPLEAEAHAREAGDWAEVGRLASGRWVERLVAGSESVPDLVGDLPAPVVTASGGLALLAAADACRRGDRPAADAYGSAVDELVEAEAAGRPPPEALGLLDVAYARAFGVDARARRAVAALEGGPAGLRHVAALRAIGLDLDEGLVESARRDAATLAFRAASGWLARDAEALLAVASAVEGDVAAAITHGQRVRAAGSPVGPLARYAASLGLALGQAQAGEPRRALDLLASVEVPDGADRWLRCLDGALRIALRRAGAVVVEPATNGTPHPLVDRALVALGVLEAIDPMGRVDLLGGAAERAVLRARQRWRERDAVGVLDAVGVAAPAVDRAHPRTAIERGALVALAATYLGDDDRGARELRATLHAADTTGIRAPLLVLAPDLMAPLAAHADALGRGQAFALDLVDRARLSPALAFVEPLTEREVAVLRRLPSLMSNHEIAEGLHVSVNTVKTHLKSMYRKLGVTNRREAVQRGRALELL